MKKDCQNLSNPASDGCILHRCPSAFQIVDRYPRETDSRFLVWLGSLKSKCISKRAIGIRGVGTATLFSTRAGTRRIQSLSIRLLTIGAENERPRIVAWPEAQHAVGMPSNEFGKRFLHKIGRTISLHIQQFSSPLRLRIVPKAHFAILTKPAAVTASNLVAPQKP